MNNFMKKAMEFIGLAEEDDEIEETSSATTVTPQRVTREKDSENIALNARKNKVVNIHTTTQLKVVVHSPSSFENAREITDHLKAKKPVIVNLENVDNTIAKRIIDFLSGAVYALDGNIQKIADRIFLIAPYNVGIMGGDFKDELKNKISFPF